MNQKKKSLILAAVILVLLIGAAVILVLTAPKEDNEETASASSESSEDTSIPLVSEEGGLASLAVTNSTGSYTIERTGEKKWSILALQAYGADDSQYASMMEQYAKLSAEQKVLDETADLAEYGMDQPAAKAVLTFDSGNTYTLLLGNQTVDGAAYYAMMEGSPVLYTVAASTANGILESQLSYLDTTLLKAFDTQNSEETPNIERMVIERKDLPTPYVIESAEVDPDDPAAAYGSSLEMVSPVSCPLDIDKADNKIVYPLFGLSATEVAALDASASAAQYGFDDPFATIQLTYDGRSANMVFGNPVDDTKESYYMTFNDNNLVYVVSTSSVAALTVDPNTIVSRLGLTPQIDTVKELHLNVNGTDHLFKLSGTDDKLKVTCNGKKVDTDNFKQLYQLILYPNLDSINYDAPQGDAAVTIQYHYRKSSGVDEIKLYNDGRKLIYSENGNPSRSGRSAYFAKLEKELKNLLDGKKVSTDW